MEEEIKLHRWRVGKEYALEGKILKITTKKSGRRNYPIIIVEKPNGEKVYFYVKKEALGWKTAYLKEGDYIYIEKYLLRTGLGDIEGYEVYVWDEEKRGFHCVLRQGIMKDIDYTPNSIKFGEKWYITKEDRKLRKKYWKI